MNENIKVVLNRQLGEGMSPCTPYTPNKYHLSTPKVSKSKNDDMIIHYQHAIENAQRELHITQSSVLKILQSIEATVFSNERVATIQGVFDQNVLKEQQASEVFIKTTMNRFNATMGAYKSMAMHCEPMGKIIKDLNDQIRISQQNYSDDLKKSAASYEMQITALRKENAALTAHNIELESKMSFTKLPPSEDSNCCKKCKIQFGLFKAKSHTCQTCKTLLCEKCCSKIWICIDCVNREREEAREPRTPFLIPAKAPSPKKEIKKAHNIVAVKTPLFGEEPIKKQERKKLKSRQKNIPADFPDFETNEKVVDRNILVPRGRKTYHSRTFSVPLRPNMREESVIERKTKKRKTASHGEE